MTVKGTLKYRKVERTPQVGKDAGKKKCRIELLDNHVTVEDGTEDNGGGNGGTTPTSPTTPSGGSSSTGSGSTGSESGPKEF